MARRGSSSGRWRHLHPGYYMKRPVRFAAVFTAFVLTTFVVWDRRSLLRDHEVGDDPFISTWVSSLILVPSVGSFTGARLLLLQSVFDSWAGRSVWHQ